MAFTFVHTGDWHVGLPYGSIAAQDPEKAASLRQARLDCVDRVAEVARQVGARHVFVAGDSFDSETLPDRSLRPVLARLSAHADLIWHLLPGNHDPVRPGGVWDRIQAFGRPGNVRLHLVPEPVMIEPGVVLLPAPLSARAMSTDPTAWMDHAESPPGVLRLGLAHGAVQNFGGSSRAAIPIDPGRVRSADLDYLALGDWHGAKQIAPRAWYAGTPEPDSFLNNQPGHVLVVRIEDRGEPPEVKLVETARFRWLDRRLRIDRLADLEPLEKEITRLGATAGRHLLGCVLEGELTASEEAALDDRLGRLQDACFFMQTNRDRLRVVTRQGDLEALGCGALRGVAQQLHDQVAGADAAMGLAAQRALAILFAQARALGALEDR